MDLAIGTLTVMRGFDRSVGRIVVSCFREVRRYLHFYLARMKGCRQSKSWRIGVGLSGMLDPSSRCGGGGGV